MIELKLNVDAVVLVTQNREGTDLLQIQCATPLPVGNTKSTPGRWGTLMMRVPRGCGKQTAAALGLLITEEVTV